MCLNIVLAYRLDLGLFVDFFLQMQLKDNDKLLNHKIDIM